MRLRIMTVGASALALAGCGGASRVVNEPSKISLQAALEETVDALFAARYRSAQHGGTAIGLNACTVTATFNVTATGTDKQGLVLNVGAPAGAPVTVGVQGSLEATASATRGNTVTVTFTSPACNPADTLGTKSPNEVAHLQWQIGAARYGGYPAAGQPSRHTGGTRPDWAATPTRRGGTTATAPAGGTSDSGAGAGGGVTPATAPRRFRPDLSGTLPGYRPDVSAIVPERDPILLMPPPPAAPGAAPTAGPSAAPPSR